MVGHLEVGAAALLHDIGKLYQRAYWQSPPDGLAATHHAGYTAWFIERHAALFANAGLEPGWLANTAKRHHNNRSTQDDFRPQSLEEWAVYYADNYASYERADSPDRGHPPSTALQPVFGSVSLAGKSQPVWGYHLEPLAAGVAYPLQHGANVRSEAYLGKLVERLEQRLTDLARLRPTLDVLIMNLAGLLYEVAWCVPSDTQGEPGVSLYDHLRLGSAIAAALWRYHQERGTLSHSALKDEAQEKFLLVIGDLGGIQEHIYRIRRAQAGTGPLAKRLRARSLEVSLSSEAFSALILNELGLLPLQRFMNAGGKFYLLLPNTPNTVQVLQGAQVRWEAHALAEGATLMPQLAWTAFAPAGFGSGDFAGALSAAHQALGVAKLRPLRSQLAHPVLYQGALRPCAAYGSVPAMRDQAGAVSHQAERDEQVGRRLPTVAALSLTNLPAEGDYRFPGLSVSLGSAAGHILRGRLDFAPSVASWEVRTLLGHIPTVAQAQQALTYRAYRGDYLDWLQQQELSREEDELSDHPERPLTLSELAALSGGAALLGAVMLDADRMGEVFEHGFTRLGEERVSVSRVASLSRLIETFFAAEVASLIRDPSRYQERLAFGRLEPFKRTHYPLIYTVYAGGDDLFLLGPWNVLLAFAIDLHRLYQQFTGDHPDFTLSGGFVMVKPHLPVPKIAAYVAEAEQHAKSAGRDRLTLFGQAVPWAELAGLQGRADALRRRLESKELPRSVAYRLLGLHRLWQRWETEQDPEGMRYKPVLAYLFRRPELQDQQAFLEPLFNHQSSEMRYLPAWVQWAIYETRGE